MLIQLSRDCESVNGSAWGYLLGDRLPGDVCEARDDLIEDCISLSDTHANGTAAQTLTSTFTATTDSILEIHWLLEYCLC
jgi:hypothetical protein